MSWCNMYMAARFDSVDYISIEISLSYLTAFVIDFVMIMYISTELLLQILMTKF